jgi:hypothetical protein
MVLPTPHTLVWEAPVLASLDKSPKKWYIEKCPRVGEPVRKGQIRKRETSRKPKRPGGRKRSRKLGRSPEVFLCAWLSARLFFAHQSYERQVAVFLLIV